MKMFFIAVLVLATTIGFQVQAQQMSTAKKIEYDNRLKQENLSYIPGKQSGGTGDSDLQIACKDKSLHIPVNFTPDFLTKWEKDNFNASCLCGGVRYAIAKICEDANKKDLATWVSTIKSKIKEIRCTYAGGEGDHDKRKAQANLKNGILNISIEHHISQNCKSAGGYVEDYLKDAL